ncbi:MAG: hypothetical protein ACI97A_003459 [Planctomycetota bacterium]
MRLPPDRELRLLPIDERELDRLEPMLLRGADRRPADGADRRPAEGADRWDPPLEREPADERPLEARPDERPPDDPRDAEDRPPPPPRPRWAIMSTLISKKAQRKAATVRVVLFVFIIEPHGVRVIRHQR